ncbi:MAG: FAD-binding protein [Deltaproteobacteria bacterium]|jgi:L-gulonolactone oxidase|nr:FAD-binding protein [Deltaproteobacteria bacterium]MBW2534872.1 FAD-binding protein [Deltaproteobacteria bacterium]
MRTATVTNWDRTQSWTPEALHEPTGEAELVAAVRRARDEGRRIKPLGSALSWSDCIDMPGRAIRFSAMDRVLEVNPDARTVRVQAGAPLHVVNDELAYHGLSFDNFGSIVIQTAAGYIGTASHGTGLRTPTLSSYVTRLRLIDGAGEMHELCADHEPALFSAARASLGCLGVITEITFRCVEAFRLEEELELVEFDRLLADLDQLVESNDYLKLWWLPYAKRVQVYKFNRTDRPGRSYGLTELIDQSGLSSYAFTGLLALSRRYPTIIPRMHELVQRVQFTPHRRFDRSDRIIRYAGTIPRHQETEYAIPVERAAEAIERTRRMVEAASYRVNFPMEVRFVAADDVPMSPAYGRDSCYLGAYVSSLEWAPRYFAEFEELMLDYDGRPHWGKTFHRTAAQLRALYPQYDDFAALRHRVDPDGIFRNRFVDRVFPE